MEVGKVITVRIETDNSAFDEEPAGEVARILRELADYVEDMRNCSTDQSLPKDLFDLNGNKCGEAACE